jgi:thymidylate kinase
MIEQLHLIKEVFKQFNKEGIQYCVLRNYEFLLGSSDPLESLDTLVAEKDLRRAEVIFKNFGFSRRKQQFSLKHKAYFKYLPDGLVSFDVQVGGIYWNDMRYLDESVLFNRIQKNYFYVPSDNDTFVMLMVHSILGKRFFKQKYQNILVNLIDKLGEINEEYVFAELARIFSNRIAKNLLTSVKENKFGDINPYTLVFHFIFTHFKHPFTFGRLFLRWVIWKKPLKPAPLISILGPDGAGKSTMVKSLQKHLKNSGRKTKLVYSGRGRDHIIPFTTLGRKYKAREKLVDAGHDGSIQEAGKNKTRLSRKLIYTASSLVFTTDLLLRYWLIMFPKRMQGKIVLTDRYCSDIILMKNVPFWFKRVLFALFPKPTFSVLLHNTPEILHERRPQEPIPELERQMEIFNKLKYSLSVKTDDKIKVRWKVVSSVMNELIKNWY